MLRPRPGYQLSGIWGSSATDIWVPTREGSLLHWDGMAWQVLPLPLASGVGISGGNGNSLWILGVDAQGRSAVAHGDGSSWTVDTLATGLQMYAIHWLADDDVWVVGGNVYHYDGFTWTDRTPSPPTTFYAVHASAADNVWVVGASGANFRWNGSAWSQKPTITVMGSLYAVHAFSPTDVWVGGDRAIVGHWQGSAWTLLSDQGSAPTMPVETIWAFGPGDLWFGGASNFHWNGSTLTPDTSLVVADARMWAAAPGDMWMIGFGQAWRNQGSGWARQYSDGLVRWAGVKVISANDVWVSGGYPDGPLHFDGVAWRSEKLPGVELAQTIWGAAVDDAWAVGLYHVYHWTPTGWVIEDPPGSLACGAMYGAVPSDVWAICGGALVHWDGGAWSAVSGLPTSGLTNLAGTSQSNVWVVGNGGVAREWNGSAWLNHDTSSWVNHAAVWTDGPGHAVASGKASSFYGALREYRGSAWVDLVAYGSTYRGLGKIVGSASDLWVIGDSDALFHWNGTTAAPVVHNTGFAMHDIWWHSAQDVWVLGAYSAFHWTGTSGVTVNGLGNLGIDGLPTGEAWVVGDYGLLQHRNAP